MNTHEAEYRTTTTLEVIAERLLGARRILLTTHARPDGDAMGSVLALARALANAERTALIWLTGPVPQSLELLAGPTPFRLTEADGTPGDAFDLAVVLDTGAWAQVEAMGPLLRAHRDRVVGIDHHARGDDVAPARYVDSTAASTTQILVRLLDAMRCPLTGGANGIAEALFAGLATDSGWFRFASAGPETFEIAARLLNAGVDKPRLYTMLEETYRTERIALEARALASIEYAGEVAIMSLLFADFAETGGSVEDLTGIVNTPLCVGSVQASVLLSEAERGTTKISLRSKPAPPESFVDVNELASVFGGGGHVQAAGARVVESLESVRGRLLDVLSARRGA